MTRTILTEAGLQVVGEADNGQDAIKLVVDLRPMSSSWTSDSPG
jgi:YesN/AraC family two-component response regulator